MTKCIAFHSYKGGTGKTTIASNLAALLAKNGYRVALLDLDVYAPSLQSYFEIVPEKWINDFLCSEDTEMDEIMIDMTGTIEDIYEKMNKGARGYSGKIAGRMWVGFSNSKKEEIYKLDSSGKQSNSKIQLLRKFINLREQIIANYNIDYLIIDTSPGIRYWSINALALADVLMLTLKMDDLDIGGTRKMALELYDSFTKFGAKSFLVLNKVAGYCVPSESGSDAGTQQSELASAVAFDKTKYALYKPILYNTDDVGKTLSDEVGMDVLSSIPCYCDIQFSRKEFLTVIRYPEHPFTKQIDYLTRIKQMLV